MSLDLRVPIGSLFGLLGVLLVAYGLWSDRAWGEWLAALSGAVYIPLEISYLTHRLSVISAVVLAGNAFVVSFLVFQLWRRLKYITTYQ